MARVKIINSLYYHLLANIATLYVKEMIVVRKFHMGICLCVMLIAIIGCKQQSEMGMLYEKVFDTLLQDDSHLGDIDYISLFIQNDDITQGDLSPIETSIRETYEKETYSYTPPELEGSGAYGKEDLNQEGVYLYITDIEESERQIVVHSEKYYTLKSIAPIGMEMTFKKRNDQWVLDDIQIEWKGKRNLSKKQ